MPKPGSPVFEVDCPCCQAKLTINAEVRAVVSHIEKERPKTLEDIATGVEKLKGAAAEREAAFAKSFQQVKTSKDVLNAKFDELLKKAKNDDPSKPPPKPLGFD